MNDADNQAALTPEERERQRRIREERRETIKWLNRAILFAFAVSAGKALAEDLLEVVDG